MSEEKAALQERLRLQTLARYFAPADITADIVRSTRDRPLAPTLSQSTQLTAITQNGALRLQCDRAFVSLIDSEHQYIIAEATRSISIRNANKHVNPQDALFLGVQALPKSYGICPNSIAIFTDTAGDQAFDCPGVVANTTRYVIRDLRELELFKDRPYVTGFPHMRSYVEVPIKSSDGRVIGTYCAMDNKVRDDFFSDETIDILTEIAECIHEHIQLQAVKQSYVRGEKLMEGLSEFTRGRSYSDKKEDARANIKPPTSASVPSAGGINTYFSDAFGSGIHPSVAATSGTSSPASSTDTSPLSGNDDHSTPATTPSETPDPALRSSSSLDLQASRHKGPGSGIFSGAANLIRESIDLEGLVFLDASNQRASRDPALVCEVLGSALASKECALGPWGTPLVLHETSLHYLAKNYPQGCSFSADEYGFLLPDGKKAGDTCNNFQKLSFGEENEAPEELFEIAAKAHSVIFLPLWDYNKNEAFFVGMVGWSTDPTRVFQEQDLTCLSAFGNALMNEVARSEAVDIAHAKSDFMSSISHELRSPLHGILASVELLQEMVIDDAQGNLIGMIQSCGTTLLDTLNHLLDFSKINDLTDTKSHVRRISRSIPKTAESAFGKPSVHYLCRLVQDVVDGVHFGQTSQQAIHQRDQASPAEHLDKPVDPAILIDSDTASPAAEEVDVAVFVYAENRPDWRMSLSAGAWKRIAMNLFANALKYTRQGQIEVSLTMTADPQSTKPGDQVTHLTVKDTGIGMSEDYIKHHLYKPFVQENPLANGTGLGLSIVKQIVGDLGGTIHVESTPGVGTRFDVLVPVPQSSIDIGQTPVTGGQLVDPTGKLKGRTICLLSIPEGEAVKHSDLARLRTETLHSHVASIAPEWFGMAVVQAQSPQDVEADFYLVEAHHLERFFPSQGAGPGPAEKQRILVVEGLQFSDVGKRRLRGTKITYPVSAKSLSRALFSSLRAPRESEPHDRSTHGGGEDAAKPSYQSPVAQTGISHGNLTSSTDSCPAAPGPVRNSTVSEPSRKHHLLLVDDNAINLKILSTYVKKLGLTADVAENGLEALELYKASRQPYTVVLMDISMPVMDGISSSRAIREYEGSNPDKIRRPARIVALTGLGSEASRQEAALSGIDDYRTKPVALKVLKDLLEA